MYTRMVHAFVGIGSVDTVVAPDSRYEDRRWTRQITIWALLG